MQVTEKHLKYFKESEFEREGRNWLPMYNPRLLILLDTFRHLTGPCILSPHPLALGRIKYDKNPGSQHIYDAEDGVRAVDVFPAIPAISIRKYHNYKPRVKASVSDWIKAALKLNFTGIGLYTWWELDGEVRPSLHLDIRKEPYQWGSIKVDGERKKVSIEQALEAL